MAKILVAYTTESGSTEEVARVVSEELGREGAQVDVVRLDQVENVDAYQAVVLGAPMILGWHRGAVNFLKKHKKALAEKKTAYFATAMSLTRTEESNAEGVPLWVDPGLAKAPKNPRHLSLRERYATPANYTGPMLRAARQVRPLSVAFFGGRMEYFRLPLWQMLFVMLIIQAQPADLRNWPAVREWAAGLRETFQTA